MSRHREDTGAGLGALGWWALLGVVVVGAAAFLVFRFFGDTSPADDAQAAGQSGQQSGQDAGNPSGSSPSAHPAGHADDGQAEETSAPAGEAVAPGGTSATDQTATTDDIGSADGTATTDAAAATDDAEGTATSGDTLTAELLAPCLNELNVGQTAVDDAAVSANNWRLHYEASLDLNAGEITIDEANEIWAETKANGPAEVSAFATAESAYRQVSGGCAALAERASGLAAEHQDTVGACTARGAALDGLVDAAAAVNSQWDEHVQMMAAKDTFDPEEYVHEWHRDVEAAPPVMDVYVSALATFEEAPDCSL